MRSDIYNMSDLKTLTINGNKYIIVDDKAQSDIMTLTNNMANKADKTELTDLVTKNELAAKNYLTEDNLTGYAKTSDLGTKADKTELTNYVTNTALEAKNYLTKHQDLTGYAKTTDLVNYATTAALDNKADKTQLNDYVTTSALDGKGYLTSHQDISGKLDKTDIGNAANKIPRYNAEGHLVLPVVLDYSYLALILSCVILRIEALRNIKTVPQAQ